MQMEDTSERKEREWKIRRPPVSVSFCGTFYIEIRTELFAVRGESGASKDQLEQNRQLRTFSSSQQKVHFSHPETAFPL